MDVKRTREELQARLDALRLDVQAKREEIRALAALLETMRPHRIGAKGIPSAEKFGDIGGRT